MQDGLGEARFRFSALTFEGYIERLGAFGSSRTSKRERRRAVRAALPFIAVGTAVLAGALLACLALASAF